MRDDLYLHALGPRPSLINIANLLDSLAAALAAAEEETFTQRGRALAAEAKLRRAEERAQAAEQERDEWSEQHQALAADHYFARAETAEAQVRELREALIAISHLGTALPMASAPENLAAIAGAALTHEGRDAE